MSTQRTPSNKKYRELTSAEKEKKLYYQKLQIMNNRLKNLKQNIKNYGMYILSKLITDSVLSPI